MHHFTAIDALPAVRPQASTPSPAHGSPCSPPRGKYSPHVLQVVTGTAAELLAFAEGIRDAVRLVEMRQLAESMDPIPGRSVVSDFLLKTVRADGTARRVPVAARRGRRGHRTGLGIRRLCAAADSTAF